MHSAERDDAGLQQADDLASIQQMAAGDAAGLASLYDRHAGSVHAVAFRVLQHPGDAGEVVHDVFAWAWRQAARYDRSRSPVDVWLLTQARQRAVARLRARQGRPEIDADGQALPGNLVDGGVPLDPSVPGMAPPADLRARVLAVAGVSEDVPPSSADVTSRRTAVASARPARPAPASWLPLAGVAALAVLLLLYAVQQRARVALLEGQLADATMRLAGTEADMREARTRVVRSQAETAVLAAGDMRAVALSGQSSAPEAVGRAFWSRAHGLVLTATRLPDLPRERTYQVWVLTDGAPVSAGLFVPDAEGRATAVFDTPVSLPQPTGVAVSVEPEGGAPAPTGDTILSGQL